MPYAKYNCLVGVDSKDEDPNEVILNFGPEVLGMHGPLDLICKNFNCHVLLVLVANYDCVATTGSSEDFKAFPYLSIC